MLDTKQSWDDLVLRHAPDEETAYRILENRLYHNITARFVQSHDYIAMERLFEIHASGEYDLIVIDTPPTRNAIDFLDAPARMADFFGSRLLRWLTLPYRVGGKRGTRVLNVASRPFYQMADRILGSQFLQDIAEFFLNFQSMYDGFVTRSRVGRTVAARQAHHLRGRHHAGGGAVARSGAFLFRARAPRTSTSVRSCSTRRCPTRCAIPTVPRPRHRVHRRRRCPWRPRWSRPAIRPWPIAIARRGSCARSGSRTGTSRWWRCARPSCGPSCRAIRPASWSRIPTFDDDISDVDGLDEIGRYLFHGAAGVSTLEDLALAAHRAVGRRSRPHGAPRFGVAAVRRPLVRRPVAARADHR